jgi:hypothetical protein
MKANEAKNTVIWVMDEDKPTQTNLYDFVMLSAEQTTSPRGVENKLHIREIERECSCVDEDGQHSEDCNKCYNGCELVYSVYDWGFRGQYLRLVETFETEAEAEDYIYTKTWEYDFNNECNRSTFYADSAAELLSDRFNISHEAAESYYQHWLIAESIREQRKKASLMALEAEIKRKQELAAIYAKMIDKVEGESTEQTAKRLSNAIGEKIEKGVFWRAIAIIRSN